MKLVDLDLKTATNTEKFLFYFRLSLFPPRFVVVVIVVGFVVVVFFAVFYFFIFLFLGRAVRQGHNAATLERTQMQCKPWPV